VLAAGLLSVATRGDDSREALERKLSEDLSGSVLVGTFSIDGQKSDKAPIPERYELESVKKLNDKLWVFTARIKYMNHDVTLPVTVPIVWAGDTPMISMTDMTIPGLGTFTARVFFYDDRYAGTWQHGAFGGHMWGKIEKKGDGVDAAKAPVEAKRPSAS
jgi:hypothetical protein